jgi:hypothetical protein
MRTITARNNLVLPPTVSDRLRLAFERVNSVQFGGNKIIIEKGQ